MLLLCAYFFLTNAIFSIAFTSNPSFRTRNVIRICSQVGDDTEEDWRNFRAKLVMQYRNDGAKESEKEKSSSSSTSWAYESGDTIEKGSIILSRPPTAESDDEEGGLIQQYFHKSIILVVEHEEKVFTKNLIIGITNATQGVILNRPSNLILSDEDFENADGSPLDESSEENKYKAWFGGEVNGYLSESAEIICLHSIKGDDADSVSETIMKSIKWTTLEGARALVKQGIAENSDFLTFIGYCGWDGDQLQSEIEEDLWYTVAVDSKTVLEQLKKNDESGGVLDAGLESWACIMRMIGRGDEIKSEESFEDLMLKEWTKERLLFPTEDEDNDMLDALLSKAAASKSFGSEVTVGSVLRSSDVSQYNPFLLSDQEYHKSILLIVQDDEELSVGVILNLPTASHIQMEFDNEKSGDHSTFAIPERYGGRFSDASDDDVLLWFHCNDLLKEKKIGEPLGMDVNSVWNVSPEDAASAIAKGEARANDFLVVSGLSIWEKTEGGNVGGIRGEVNNNLFEVVSVEDIPHVFDILLEQEVMTSESVEENLSLIDLAWSDASPQETDNEEKEFKRVYKSDKTISELSDDALERWIRAFVIER